LIAAVDDMIPGRRSKTSPFRWPFLVFGLVAMALFAVDTVAAHNVQYLPFDVPFERFIQSINWGPLVQVFTALDWVEGTKQQLVAVAGILLVAAVNWRAIPLMLFGAASGLIYTITATLIDRPRPSDELVHVIRHTGASSYPSGHVAFFCWFLILLILCLLVGRVPRVWVAVAWVAAALFLLAVSIGRIYIGEHWPSDILGGLFLGLGWTSIGLSIRLLSNPVLERKKR
jgi:membrane-associated phospholipid phosphatase